jgi:hypothetical protein
MAEDVIPHKFEIAPNVIVVTFQFSATVAQHLDTAADFRVSAVACGQPIGIEPRQIRTVEAANLATGYSFFFPLEKVGNVCG